MTKAVVVEQSRPCSDMIRIVLKTLGVYDIAEAADGEEAMIRLKNGGTDILILDQDDGVDFVRRIRNGCDGINPRTRIILLADDRDTKARRAAYAAGADHFIEKPFSFQRFHASVNRVLAG